MVEARELGLTQLTMRTPWTYYNIGLPDWERDNIVVAGVEAESLAPVTRVRLTMAEFQALLKRKYGGRSDTSLAAQIQRVCTFHADGTVEAPVIRR
jgi:hypothetical protein